MNWLKNLNPFKKEQVDAPASTPGAEGAGIPELPAGVPKGMMAKFMGKLKDPAFMKQLRALASHMQKDGIDVKDMGAVKAWLEKNKEAIERGDFKESATGPGVTFEKKGPEVGRNEPCHCGSGKKFKKCHGA